MVVTKLTLTFLPAQALQSYEYMLHLPRPSSVKVPRQREYLEHLRPKADISRNDHRIIRGEAVGFLVRLFYYDPAEAAEGWYLKLRGRIEILFRDLSWRDIVGRRTRSNSPSRISALFVWHLPTVAQLNRVRYSGC
jgi:hypothetical protein